MDKDSIREFLEKRHKELLEEEPFPKISKKPEALEEKKVKKPKNKKILLFVFLFLLVSGLVLFSKEVYERWREADINRNENILKNVGKLTELPIGETPTVATVTNAEELKRQVFFREAEIGDKVLIFNRAKKAILYRPSINRVISIVPLN